MCRNGKPCLALFAKSCPDVSVWAKTGKLRSTYHPPADKDRKLAKQEYQRGELEPSITYCKSIGLGRRKD